MQIQSKINSEASGTKATYYKNSFQAVKIIAREEGIRGIYRGYAATLLSFGPFSALYFTFYEEVSTFVESVASGYNLSCVCCMC